MRCSVGLGGAYFMQDSFEQNYFYVFKPIVEEPIAINNPTRASFINIWESLKKGTRVGIKIQAKLHRGTKIQTQI